MDLIEKSTSHIWDYEKVSLDDSTMQQNTSTLTTPSMTEFLKLGNKFDCIKYLKERQLFNLRI